MVPGNSKTIPMFDGITGMTSAGTVFGQVDTIGHDYLNVNLAAGTGAGAQTAVTALRFCESDTDSAMTAYTDGTPITAFVGAVAVSTSAGFVLPALSSTKQNIYRFNMTLLGRKRYIGIDLALPEQTVSVVALATLDRTEDSAVASATQATTADGTRLVVSG